AAHRRGGPQPRPGDRPPGAPRTPADRRVRPRRRAARAAREGRGLRHAAAGRRGGVAMTTETVALAVDGGNSKTDLALVRADGAVLSVVRGSLSTPHRLGLNGSVDVLQALLENAAREARLDLGDGP